MPWRKVPPELTAFMDGAVAPLQCQRRMMFGCPAYFVNDPMFAGVHQDSVILRLSEADRKALLAECDEAAPFEPMPGRPMREYLVVPESLCGDRTAFAGWLERSFGYARSLPPKPAKESGAASGPRTAKARKPAGR
jgi:TfoX/Sxy family transcriptional regulator of competence genes